MNENDLIDCIPQNSYVPAPLDANGILEHPPLKMSIAIRTMPEQICGKARRIGYTTIHNDALGLYRIKTQADHRNSYVTLPSIFVLVDGIFQDYQEWFNSNQA